MNLEIAEAPAEADKVVFLQRLCSKKKYAVFVPKALDLPKILFGQSRQHCTVDFGTESRG